VKMPIYDIFSGLRENGPIWVEAVDGLEAACARMRERADHNPGAYFVFCSQTNAVLASVDTSNNGPAAYLEKRRGGEMQQYVHTLLFACPSCNFPIVIGRLRTEKLAEQSEALLIKCSFCGKSFKIPSHDARKHYVEDWPDSVNTGSRAAFTNSD